ncbi:MAG: TRAP transporter small permease [Myxococcales bacterium]|nr:TRAP transporter small permease [Myxococcales bacterium]
MELIGKIDRALAKVEEIVLALLLVGMVVLAATQVLLRNIWNTAIDWADISLQNVTVIVGLLGAAIATSEGRHLNIDIFSRRLSGRGRLTLRCVIGVFAVIVCWYLTKGGWATYKANYGPWLAKVPEGWTAGKLLRQELAEGSFPQWLTQLPLAFGFGLIGLHFALRLIRDIGSLATGKEWEPDAQKGPTGDAVLDEMQAKASLEEDQGKQTETPAEEKEEKAEKVEKETDDDDKEEDK